MTREQFKTRTKAVALRAIKAVGSLPSDATAQVVGRRLIRSATAAHYRADFVAKMGLEEEECAEILLWFEMLIDPGKRQAFTLAGLPKEGDAILSLVVASLKTARRGS